VVLTGAPDKLLSLLGIGSSIGDWLVVDGDWNAMDGVGVHVQSALVPSRKSAGLARKLAGTDPFQAYLPRLEVYEDAEGDTARSHEPYLPWVVTPERDARLDVADALGVARAGRRTRLSSAVNAFGQLSSNDPYHRTWRNPAGNVVVQSEVWNRRANGRYGDCGSDSRLQCRSTLVKNLLSAKASHLLILVMLRYESGYASRASLYWHTTAVVRVDKSLKVTVYPGLVNELYESMF
jgi:hypothetical protein